MQRWPVHNAQRCSTGRSGSGCGWPAAGAEGTPPPPTRPPRRAVGRPASMVYGSMVHMVPVCCLEKNLNLFVLHDNRCRTIPDNIPKTHKWAIPGSKQLRPFQFVCVLGIQVRGWQFKSAWHLSSQPPYPPSLSPRHDLQRWTADTRTGKPYHTRPFPGNMKASELWPGFFLRPEASSPPPHLPSPPGGITMS